MTTGRTTATQPDAVTTDAAEMPWYELINDAPEPPEDAMQQASTIHYVMSILRARYENDPLCSGRIRLTLFTTLMYPARS